MEDGLGIKKYGCLGTAPTILNLGFLLGDFGDLVLGLQTVAKVQVNSEGRIQGVVLQGGEEVRSRVVLSCASPQVTFLELTPQVRRVRGEMKCLPHRPWSVVWGARITSGRVEN